MRRRLHQTETFIALECGCESCASGLDEIRSRALKLGGSQRAGALRIQRCCDRKGIPQLWHRAMQTSIGRKSEIRLVWSPEAIQDLISIRAYIAEENPAAARRIVLRILHDVEHLLPDNPQMGRPGRVPETRELVVPRTI
jgi:plasmid stabilization system protein ParE